MTVKRPEFLKGQQLSAAEFRRSGDTVQSRDHVSAPAGLEVRQNGAGVMLNQNYPERFWAQIGTRSGSAYGWSQRWHNYTTAGFAPTFNFHNDGLTGTPTVFPAHEVNGNTGVAAGTVAELRRGAGDFYTFSHCCEVQSPLTVCCEQTSPAVTLPDVLYWRLLNFPADYTSFLSDLFGCGCAVVCTVPVPDCSSSGVILGVFPGPLALTRNFINQWTLTLGTTSGTQFDFIFQCATPSATIMHPAQHFSFLFQATSDLGGFFGPPNVQSREVASIDAGGWDFADCDTATWRGHSIGGSNSLLGTCPGDFFPAAYTITAS